MPLEVTLKIARTDLLMQESADCIYTVTNVGSGDEKLLDPSFNKPTPIVKVLQVKTGVPMLFKREPDPAEQPTYKTIGPKETRKYSFSLLQKARFPIPGEYDVSVIVPHGIDELPESKPVRVKILPHTPANLVVVNPDKSVFYASWVNAAGDSPTLVRAKVELTPGGGITALDAICKVPIQTRASISCGPNRSSVNSHWLAWKENDRLRFVHFDIAQGATPPATADLPKGEVQIVDPLASDVPARRDARPDGHVLLCVRDASSNVALVSMRLTTGGAAIEGQAGLPGDRPLWLQSRVFKTGARHVLFCRRQAGPSVALSIRVWPGQSQVPDAPPRKLAEWPGEFVAASARMDETDAIQGAALIWTGDPPARRLELIRFRTDAQDAYKELGRDAIEWDEDTDIAQALVRPFQTGHVAVAVRSAAGKWSAWDSSRKLVLLPMPLAITKLPLEVGFVRADEPIFLAAAPELGMRLLKLDGSELKIKLI